MLQRQRKKEWGILVRRSKRLELFSHANHWSRQYVEGLLRCIYSHTGHLVLYLHHSLELLRFWAAWLCYNRLLGRRVFLLPWLHVLMVLRIQRCWRTKDCFWIQENCETVRADLVHHRLHFNLSFSNFYFVGRLAYKVVPFTAYAPVGKDFRH